MKTYEFVTEEIPTLASLSGKKLFFFGENELIISFDALAQDLLDLMSAEGYPPAQTGWEGTIFTCSLEDVAPEKIASMTKYLLDLGFTEDSSQQRPLNEGPNGEMPLQAPFGFGGPMPGSN